jgi:hypothetical protein
VHGLRQTYHRLINHFGRTRWYSLGTRLKWMLILFRLEIVLILMQDRCTVYAKRTIGSDFILDTPDGTTRWLGSCGISFWSVWSLCQIVHGLRQTYHWLRNHFGCTQWYSSVTWVLWNLLVFHLEIVSVSMQDRCTVCAKHTIGSEVILDTSDGTPMWRGSSGSLIQSIWR